MIGLVDGVALCSGVVCRFVSCGHLQEPAGDSTLAGVHLALKDSCSLANDQQANSNTASGSAGNPTLLPTKYAIDDY